MQAMDESLVHDYDMDDKALEFLPTPTVTCLTSVSKHQNQPLFWHHQVNLMGEKCPNPRIHLCDSCQEPILVYGRLVSPFPLFSCLSLTRRLFFSCLQNPGRRADSLQARAVL